MKLLVNSLLVSLLCLMRVGPASAQLAEVGCPMDGAPQIRPGDSVAQSGGDFNSSRQNGAKHQALDLNGSVGDSVYAVLDGRVALATQKDWGPMGKTVIIDHGAGAYTVYGHLDTVTVTEGSFIKKGDQIGTIGYSGNASALKQAGLPPHLHFMLIQAGQTGLADQGKPLRRMRWWGDLWRSLDSNVLAGPVDPRLFLSAGCWSETAQAPAPPTNLTVR